MATQFLTEALGTALGSPAMGGLPKLPAAEKRIGPSPEEDIARAEGEIKSTLTKREDLTEKLGKAVIAKADYDLKEKAFGAEQQSQAAKKSKILLDDLESKFANSPEYKEYQANADKTAEELTFKPSQENAQTLALVFSVISASGFLLGGLNKKNALSAMYAMNGLTEGYAKGREDLFKQERQTFETNVKAMQDRMRVLKDKLDVGIKTLARDKERGELEIQAAMAEANADFLKSQKDARGVIATREILENQIKQLDKSLDFLRRSEEKYKAQQLQGYWNQERLNMQEKLNTATNETRERLAAESAQRQREMAYLRAELRPPKETSQRASQQQAITQRAVNALGGVASAMETIVELPQGSTTGWLPNLQTKDGMFNAVRNQLGRKISPVDADLMNTAFTGIGRNLASIESSGLASGLSTLANQMEKGTYINAGVDDPYKVAMKLADIKRIATENIQPSIDSGLMTDKQAKTAQDLVNRIDKIVPYNTRDVAIAYREATSRTRGKPTVGQSSAQVAKPGEGWSDKDERRLQELEEKARGSQPK
jgi:nitroreductase